MTQEATRVEHTPGPWGFVAYSEEDERTYRSIGTIRPENNDIGLGPIAKIGTNGGRPEQEANARLIAAAPSLYDALGDLMQDIWDGEGHAYDNPDLCSAAIGCRRCEVEDKARAAIALVRGEEK